MYAKLCHASECIRYYYILCLGLQASGGAAPRPVGGNIKGVHGNNNHRCLTKPMEAPMSFARLFNTKAAKRLSCSVCAQKAVTERSGFRVPYYSAVSRLRAHAVRASERPTPSGNTLPRLALGNVGRIIRDAEREAMAAVRMGARAARSYCTETLSRVAASDRKGGTRPHSCSRHCLAVADKNARPTGATALPKPPSGGRDDVGGAGRALGCRSGSFLGTRKRGHASRGRYGAAKFCPRPLPLGRIRA